MFQMIAGLRYAFPRRMAKLEPKYPRTVALHDRVSARPRLAAYLASRGACLSTRRHLSPLSGARWLGVVIVGNRRARNVSIYFHWVFPNLFNNSGVIPGKLAIASATRNPGNSKTPR